MDYDDTQRFIFNQATQLASNGEECNHLVKLLSPEYTLRLRTFVRSLPEDIREQSIFGKANPPAYAPKTRKKAK